MSKTEMGYPLATDSWDDKELRAIQRVVESNRFTMGPEVAAFERAFAEHFGAAHAVMVNSGSSANLLAIAGLVHHPDGPLSPGDEVIVPAVSWSTTYFPVQQYGMSLRFVDVDPHTLNLDLDRLESAITPRSRAVFAVNLLGNPVDFERLRALCDRRHMLLIEDNCESMGARLNGRFAGTFGLCGTFSTFFSHHISTMEGGVVVTDDTVLYRTMLSLRAHGWVREQPADSHLAIDDSDFVKMFRFVLPGYNLRPLEMSGAIGREQLTKLPALVEGRRRNANLFREACGSIDGIRLQRETGESSWFGFSLVLEGRLAGRRPALVDALTEAGIESRPVVSGNFVRNPVVDRLDHSIGSSLEAADQIDANGLFVGNHHFDMGRQIGLLGDVLRDFADSDGR